MRGARRQVSRDRSSATTIRQGGHAEIGITGSSGVLGRIAVARLAEQSCSISCFAGDIRSYDAVRDWLESTRPMEVIHLAARVPVDIVKRDPVAALEVNAGGTLNLLKAMASSTCTSWLFFASTSHVYASRKRPLKETDRVAPQTMYGATKWLAEEVVRFFVRARLVRACIGRIFSFYHETQKKPFLYPVILERLASHAQGQRFLLQGGNDVRDFLNAEDVVDVILKLRERQHEGTVNIGSGRGMTVADFVRRVAKRPLVIEIPPAESMSTLVANVSRLRAVIG